MKNLIFLFTLTIFLLSSCIKDDIINDLIDPVLRISTLVDTIEINTSFQFESTYLNNVGREETVTPIWTSSNPDVISIDVNGLALANQIGSAIISVEYDDGNSILNDAIEVNVGETTVMTNTNRSGTIKTTSSYKLTGDFEIRSDGNDIILDIAENYEASTALPGLYVYLTNNPNTTSNALEIGKVTTFSGAHSYTIQNTEINDYNYVLYFCKPFNVKVGDGEISN